MKSPSERATRHLTKVQLPLGSARTLICGENDQTEAASLRDETVLFNGSCFTAAIAGEAATILKLLPSDTFHVVVTSPPYFWARDYQVDSQIGHEDSAEEYVSRLLSVLDEVHRVLHPEGVFYLNIADTYYSGNGQPHGHDPRSPSRNFMRKKLRAVDRSGWDIPKKSLIGIPWKVAFALQERGWTLRNDIIWNRCNAFAEPTAVDRPHRQYEHIFLLSKSRFYSYDRSALGDEEDVWNIPIERGNDINHNAPFPAELARRCILTGSPPGGFVLDPFVGSGTTLRAALASGRNSIGIDLNPGYVKSVVRMLEFEVFRKVAWDHVTHTLAREPEAWRSWRGNRRNYRKPGTHGTSARGDRRE